jgi:dolichyl-phosphate beta-glucosyltransferase
VPRPASSLRSLSVIIPAKNASAVLAATLDDIADFTKDAELDNEIIVVDDGSTDATGIIAKTHPSRPRLLVNDRNRGKGYSVRRAMLESTHDWALLTDADNATSIDHLDRFAPFARDYDVIIASRRLPGSRIVRPQPRIRQKLGQIYPHLVRIVALPEISDSQAGFKLFSRDAARVIFSHLRTERFAFDTEALLLARLLNYRIAEVAIDWNNPADSSLDIRTDTFRMMYDLMRMTLRLRLLKKSLPLVEGAPVAVPTQRADKFGLRVAETDATHPPLRPD